MKHHVFVQSYDHLKSILDRYNLTFLNIFNLRIEGKVVLLGQLYKRLNL